MLRRRGATLLACRGSIVHRIDAATKLNDEWKQTREHVVATSTCPAARAHLRESATSEKDKLRSVIIRKCYELVFDVARQVDEKRRGILAIAVAFGDRDRTLINIHRCSASFGAADARLQRFALGGMQRNEA